MWRALIFVLMVVAPAAAQRSESPPASAAPSTAEQRAVEARAALEDGMHAATAGPAVVIVRDQANLLVAPGLYMIPQMQAQRIMRALGYAAGPSMVGLITDERSPWLVVIDYMDDGHIKDDDAKGLKSSDILTSLREGTEQENKDRAAHGFPELEVAGWLEPPRYDATAHRLSWVALERRKNDEPAAESVEDNTQVLGRTGYVSLDLRTSRARFDQDKFVAITLLDNLIFLPGHRYEDFNGATDRVATWHTAAQPSVAAVKKPGLLASAELVLVTFAKVGALVLAGVGALFLYFLMRRKAE